MSFFDEFHNIFKQNQEELTPIFLKKKPNSLIDTSKKEEVLGLHEAYVNEMKTSFSQALGKDRMYQRPVGFMQDQQIWMIGVQVRYFVKQVLHFDHADFMKALKEDVQPLLGELGIWSLTNYMNVQKDKGKIEKKKMAAVAIEILKNYLEHGLDYLN